MTTALRVFAAFIALICATAAHAQNSQTQLQTQITSTFPDNTTFSITPAAVRGFLSSFVSSYNQFGASCATSSLSSYQWFANTAGSPSATKLGIFNSATNSCLPVLDLNETTGALTLDPAVATNFGPPPNTSIAGPPTIVSGLVPTWPTAPMNACYIQTAGSGYGAPPTSNVLGGITNGGTGGGSITLTVSGGALNTCSIAAGGSYSFPPTIYLSTGNGTGTVVSQLASTETFSTSAGVINVNGVPIAVPSYNHTYAATLGTTTTYCDFISTTTGAWTTQAAGVGNGQCQTPPSGNILLRIVTVGSGTYEAWSAVPPSFVGTNGLGVQDGVIAIQYYVGQPAAYAYYDSNTRDWPPVETRLLTGIGGGSLTNPNSALFNGACMQGKWGGRQGNCMINGQYLVVLSNDQEPAPYLNFLDAGPILVLARGTAADETGNTRAGVTGDLLGYLVFEGTNSSSGTVQYANLLTRVANASNSSGELHLMTATGTDGVASRLVLGGGLYATPAVSGINSGACGQNTTPGGSPATMVDKGPSTINICGQATNTFSNPMGYYLDNKPALLDGFTIANLPTCNAGAQGARAYVTNGVASPTFGGTVSTTGSTVDPVFCTGSAWVYG